jgi:hypothetical protein
VGQFFAGRRSAFFLFSVARAIQQIESAEVSPSKQTFESNQIASLETSSLFLSFNKSLTVQYQQSGFEPDSRSVPQHSSSLKG